MGDAPPLARVTVTWGPAGIMVDGNVPNPTAVFMLEAGKAMMMQRTIGPPRDLQAGKMIANAGLQRPPPIDRRG